MKKTFTLIITAFCATTLLFGQTPAQLEKVGDFWEIDTPEDFIWLADTVSLDADNDGTPDFDSIGSKMEAKYRLIADITFDPDSSLVDWNNDGTVDIAGSDSNGLWPIGTKVRDNGDFIHFKGHFDGQYHTISNVYMAYSYSNRSGLFGGIEGGTIENLRVMNFNSHPTTWYPAILVGRASYVGTERNTIKRCWVEGTIHNIPGILDDGTPRDNVFAAGITGRLENGDISECIAKITAHANTENQRRIGGITGRMGVGATIKDCYSVSVITAEEESGLILGYAKNETTADVIENCYSVGVVTSQESPPSDIGNFAGKTGACTVTSCYWDTEQGGVAAGAGEGTNAANVVGLTTAEFASESSFVGWDFSTIWKMGTVDGDARPILQWQELVGGEVSVNDLQNKNLIKAYPNPVSGILTIENAPINDEYRMINMIGQTVESGLVKNSTMILNLENYEKGIYMLKIGDSVNKIFVK